jgi:hypothetical protein
MEVFSSVFTPQFFLERNLSFLHSAQQVAVEESGSSSSHGFPSPSFLQQGPGCLSFLLPWLAYTLLWKPVCLKVCNGSGTQAF